MIKKPPFKILISVLLIAVIAISVYGAVYGIKEEIRQGKKAEKYNVSETEPIAVSAKKKVYKTKDYQITLTEDFENDKTNPEYNEFYSPAVTVLISIDTFEENKEFIKLSETDYIDYLMAVNGYPRNVRGVTQGGINYFEYRFGGTEQSHYYVFVIKGEQAFYCISFVFRTTDKERLTPYIMEWLESFEHSDK